MHDLYRGKDCMKNFCKTLKEQAVAIIHYLWKKENSINNKQTSGIMWKGKNLLYSIKNVEEEHNNDNNNNNNNNKTLKS